MNDQVDDIREDISEFIDHLKRVFKPGGPEVTVFVHNTKIENADLLVTSGDWDRIVPPLKAFLNANGADA